MGSGAHCETVKFLAVQFRWIFLFSALVDISVVFYFVCFCLLACLDSNATSGSL